MMRYKFFGRGTGLRVSELCLGCGVFGTRLGYGTPPAEARRIVHAYLEAGGNFIDTADTYEAGESEEILGEAIRSRRDDIVLATKFSYGTSGTPPMFEVGNNRKTMARCLDGSLKRLKTDRIDLYWVHISDEVTAIDEIMRGLDDLVRSGKILYIGFSNFPAWRVARAATLAELRNLAPVTGLQLEYSLIERTSDRELLPMAQALGIGVVGWSPLGGGLLTGKYRKSPSGRAVEFPVMVHPPEEPRNRRIVDAVIDIAQEVGATPTQVSLAWIKTRSVIPIIGPRTLDQFTDNLGAAEVNLSAEQTGKLDSVSKVGLGFPQEMLGGEYGREFFVGGTEDDAWRRIPVS